MNWASRAILVCIATVAPSFAAENPPSDWARLDAFQETITRDEFVRLLNDVYCPNGELDPYLDVSDEAAELFADRAFEKNLFRLRFAPSETKRKPLPTEFKTLATLHALKNPADAPLRGVRIALDPGHIGGEFAQMEQRHFIFAENKAIQEAALNLTVARLLKPQLEAAGATVLMVKNSYEPTTKQRPEDFRGEAEKHVDELLRTPAEKEKLDAMDELERDFQRSELIRKRMELLFYRVAEIRARADHINNKLKPDLTLCIHFNARAWDDPPKLVEDNSLTIFIHGGYKGDEVATEQRKFELMNKLLEGSHAIELLAAEKISRAMAVATNLPPINPNPRPLTTNPYIIPRNFIANRIFHGPVLYLEPYYQNNLVTYARLLAGDYKGEREIPPLNPDGTPVPNPQSPISKHRSIFREYADSVAKGLIEFYSEHTITKP